MDIVEKDTPFERHPLSKCWPDQSEEEYSRLQEDVKENGVLEPIVLHEDGRVLDGWHRYLAATALGCAFPTDTFVGPDAAAFVISRNAVRRHLTKTQVAEAVVACRSWRLAGRVKADDPEAGEAKTNLEMADEANVSPATISRAKRNVLGKTTPKPKKPKKADPPAKTKMPDVTRPLTSAESEKLIEAVAEKNIRMERMEAEIDVYKAASSEDTKKVAEQLDSHLTEIHALRSQVAEWQQKCQILTEENTVLRRKLKRSDALREQLSEEIITMEAKAIQKDEEPEEEWTGLKGEPDTADPEAPDPEGKDDPTYGEVPSVC